MIIDCAVYTKGERRPGRLDLEGAFEAASEPDSFVWIGVADPESSEFDEIIDEFQLHALAVEDAVCSHQRPKVEVYDDMLFVVLKTARYDDASETVEFSELQVFVGPTFVVSVRHGQASALHDVRIRLEENPDLLSHGPASVLHAIIDKVVDDYGPVVAGLDHDISEIEGDVFRADRSARNDPSHRIYMLKREVLDFHRNTKPFLEALGNLASGRVVHCHNPGLREYFRDVHDHLLLVVSEIEDFSSLLSDVLEANLAQISVRQNDDMRKMSAWLAIGAFPTVVGAIYGMNFESMPELSWSVGYPLVLVFTGFVCLLLYRQFKRSGWL